MKKKVNIERSLITGMLSGCDELEEIFLRVRPEMFFEANIRPIANAIWTKKTINIAVIADEVAIYGVSADELGQIVIASIDGEISELIEEIINRFVSYEFVNELNETAKNITAGGNPYEEVDRFEAQKDKIINEHENAKTPHISQSSKEVAEDAKNAADGQYTGIPTGFREFDKVTVGGWEPTDQTIVGANSSHGKTTMMLNLALGLAKQGIPVLIISIESPAKQLTRRIIAMESGITMKELKRGPDIGVDVVQWKKEVDAWREKVNELPIYIENNDGSLSKILNVYRSNVRNNGVKFVFLDYLQECRTSQNFDTIDLKLGYISQRLKNCATLYNTKNFILSQCTKSPMNDKRPPGRGDLKNGGPAGYIADMILMLCIPANFQPGEAYPIDSEGNSINGLMQVFIAKYRDGSLGMIEFRINNCLKLTPWNVDFEDVETLPEQNLIGPSSRPSEITDDMPF